MSEAEYNNCVTSYADNVYRFILKNIKHEEDAKDIVQSTFEKLWVNCKIVDNEKCKSYLFTVAYHTMIDSIRKNKKVVLKDDMEHVQHNTVAAQQSTPRILQEALNTLNERDRSLVTLKDYEGYNYAEIGQITNLGESQVKVYLHRARLKLRNYLVKIENVV